MVQGWLLVLVKCRRVAPFRLAGCWGSAVSWVVADVHAGTPAEGAAVLAGTSVTGGWGTGTVVLAGGVVLALGEVTAGEVTAGDDATGDDATDVVPDGAGVWEEVPEQADKAPAARRLQQPRIDFTCMARILLRGRR